MFYARVGKLVQQKSHLAGNRKHGRTAKSVWSVKYSPYYDKRP